jgi:hypothetical protein
MLQTPQTTVETAGWRVFREPSALQGLRNHHRDSLVGGIGQPQGTRIMGRVHVAVLELREHPPVVFLQNLPEYPKMVVEREPEAPHPAVGDGPLRGLEVARLLYPRPTLPVDHAKHAEVDAARLQPLHLRIQVVVEVARGLGHRDGNG